MKIHKPALTGILVVEVNLSDDSTWPAVASLGTRPTIGGTTNVLEVHLLDFSSDLYGQRIQVRFLKKLRDEVKFSSIETMCEQVHQDIIRTREYFRHKHSRCAS